MNAMAVLVMGSESDLEEAIDVEERLVNLQVPVERHILSAHRNTGAVIEMIIGCDSRNSPLVYVAFVGKKPDLGPVIAGNTDNPVVMYVKKTEPETFYPYHLMSALDAPPGVSYAVFSDPVNAALYVAKMVGLQVPDVRQAVNAYRTKKAAANLTATEKYGSVPLGELREALKKK